MTDRVLLVGQAPSRRTDGGPPFSGRSGAALARLAGIAPDALRSAYALANVLDAYPGRRGRGDAFSPVLARESASRMALAPRTVFVGAAVARAFGHRAPPLVWAPLAGRPGVRAALLPHPSGLNLWYNDPDNRARAGAFLKELLP